MGGGKLVGSQGGAGVIELAFAHLGAAAVTSSVFEANRASRAVSRKLGYDVVGQDTVNPRSVPMPHMKLRLERAAWRGAPFQLEIEGMDDCLPLFGAA